jgi:hypothetical protein
LVKSFSTAVKEEDMKNDTPTEWLINHHKPEIKATDQHNQAFVMLASMAEMNEEGELCIHTITSSFVLKVNQVKKKGDSDEVLYSVVNPMQALVEIGAFFSFLHVITKASVSHQRHLPVLSPKALMELWCRSPRLIDRAHVSIDKPGNNAKKSELVSALVAGRQQMFDKYPDIRKKIVCDIKRDYTNKGISTRESREELMKNTLFALSESVCSREQYNSRNA